MYNLLKEKWFKWGLMGLMIDVILLLFTHKSFNMIENWGLSNFFLIPSILFGFLLYFLTFASVGYILSKKNINNELLIYTIIFYIFIVLVQLSNAETNHILAIILAPLLVLLVTSQLFPSFIVWVIKPIFNDNTLLIDAIIFLSTVIPFLWIYLQFVYNGNSKILLWIRRIILGIIFLIMVAGFRGWVTNFSLW